MADSQKSKGDEKKVSNQHNDLSSDIKFNEQKANDLSLTSESEYSSEKIVIGEQDPSINNDIGDSIPQLKEQPKTKKNPAEVFQELKNVVVGIDIKLDEVQKFVHIAKDKLLRESEEYIEKGKTSVLDSLFELHDILFRKVMAMEAGEIKPDSFVIEIMDYVQEIIKKHGIDIIIPQPGERFDMNYMESLRSLPAKFWRRPDTVANVDKCGYSKQITTGKGQVIRPARVIVYRK